MSKLSNIDLLKNHLLYLQKGYKDYSELSAEDILSSETTSKLDSTDNLLEEDKAEYENNKRFSETRKSNQEQVARLADENGFEGSLYRDLVSGDFDYLLTLRRLRKQIEFIPKIIAKIESNEDYPYIPPDAELLTIPQVAVILQWGESTVRERDRKGLLPMPIRSGGTIQWYKKELYDWMGNGCPPRQEWERIKKANYAKEVKNG